MSWGEVVGWGEIGGLWVMALAVGGVAGGCANPTGSRYDAAMARFWFQR